MSTTSWRVIAIALIVAMTAAGCGAASDAAPSDNPTAASSPAAAATATSPPVPAFTPGATLPTEVELAQAVSDSVNVLKWPSEPPIGSFPFNKDACVNGKDAVTKKVACEAGDPNGTHTMVVYGDSHALQWAAPLGLTATEKGWRIVVLTQSSCPPAEFSVYLAKGKRHYTECDEFRAQSLVKIGELHPDIVFISGQRDGIFLEKDGKLDREGTTDAWAAGLAVTINKLKQVAGRVIVIGDIPYWNKEPSDCLTSHADDARQCSMLRSDAELVSHNQMEKRVAGENGATYIDTVHWQCTDTVCPAVIAGFNTRRDKDHISLGFSFWLRGVLATAAGLDS
jgi:SGNH domain-containing protein